MPKELEIPKSKTQDTLQFWADQIESAKKHLEKFHSTGQSIIDSYRDEKRFERGNFDSKYNILYSNTETMLPILFSETPETDVRAQDTTSMPARQAAKMLEDTLNYGAKTPETMAAIKACVKDLLLPGMGVMRVCYKPTIAEEEVEVSKFEIDEDGVEIETKEMEEKVVFEEIRYEYMHWNDILFPEYRRWADLPWLGFRGLFSYDEAIEEFGAGIAGKLDYVFKDKAADPTTGQQTDTSDSTKFGLAEVHEIWDKTNRRVVWLGSGKQISAPLRIDEDPLELDEFFPVPEPIFSSTTNDRIIPVPLFVQYQDLADELDEISTRIRRIVNQLKRRGVYDSSFPELQQLQDAGDDNFVPVKDFKNYQQKGGLKAIMDSEDISTAIGVLDTLYKARQEIINSIFQVMGYADVLRGVSDPRDTATAQRIKGRFGTLRISQFQKDVQRLVRDMLRIGGEIIVNKFSDKTIALQTAVPIDQVGVYQEILGQTEPSSIMIDIQTDSTIAADDIADKENIIEFTAAISDFVQRAPGMVQVLGLPATSELLMVLLRKFKMGRDIEQAVIDQVREVTQKEQEQKGQPKPPSPEELKMQLEQQKLQQQAAKDAADLQVKQVELQLKNKELDIRAGEIGLKDVNEKHKIDLKGVEMAIKQISELREAELKQEALRVEAANPDDNAVVGV
jgi:hypothetical protein